MRNAANFPELEVLRKKEKMVLFYLSTPGNLVPVTVDECPDLPQLSITVSGHTRAVHYRTFGDPADPVSVQDL